MSLDDLIAERRVMAPITEKEIRDEVERQNAAEKPRGVAQVVTPNGLEIYYQAAPKRLYRVRWHESVLDKPWFSNYAGAFDWVEVPSISTVCDSLPKFLDHWGCKIGVEGLQKILLTRADEDPSGNWFDLLHAPVDDVMDLLKAAKLTPYYQKDKAATRGTNVHKALELFIETGTMPNPDVYPENERGYVVGLVAFLQDANPVPFHSELMVASMDGFAGRFDLLANLDFSGQVVVKSYPKREPKRESVGGVWLLDAKTSKDIYPSHKVQLAAYAKGYVECGYGEAPDHMGVIHLFPDGRYELVETNATYEDFLHVLDVYHVLERLK